MIFAFAIAAVAGGFVAAHRSGTAAQPSLCPRGQRPVLTGAGKAMDGSYLVTIGCDLATPRPSQRANR